MSVGKIRSFIRPPFHATGICFADIVPCDAIGPKGFIEDKMIIDDVLKDILVMPLAAADAKLTVSVHSIQHLPLHQPRVTLEFVGCFRLLPQRHCSRYAPTLPYSHTAFIYDPFPQDLSHYRCNDSTSWTKTGKYSFSYMHSTLMWDISPSSIQIQSVICPRNYLSNS